MISKITLLILSVALAAFFVSPTISPAYAGAKKLK